VRICLVYDRFYPIRIGGAERWMRDLSVRLAEQGHRVTYLTERRWPTGAEPRPAGVEVVGLASHGGDDARGRRPLGPPFHFGLEVLRHLWKHGGRYDVVHTASFPFFPLLAAAALRRRSGYRLVVDWHEVWTKPYWRSYAGAVVGTAGWLVQRTCIRIPHRAFCDSCLTARRLYAEGFRGPVSLLSGMYSGPVIATRADLVEPVVVYAGRFTAHKRVPSLVRAFALVQERHPDMRLALYGDGPDRKRVEQLVVELGLEDRVHVYGTRTEEDVAHAVSRAACLATASEREGYGLVVAEAAARGTPSVIVAGPENAALELVMEGVNGAVSPTSRATEIAAAILRVMDAGAALRESTERWFSKNASRLLIDNSVEQVIDAYAGLLPASKASSRRIKGR
jgi:glycosyltransferase involved in cell wall biosynthesis